MAFPPLKLHADEKDRPEIVPQAGAQWAGAVASARPGARAGDEADGVQVARPGHVDVWCHSPSSICLASEISSRVRSTRHGPRRDRAAPSAGGGVAASATTTLTS